MQGSNGSRTFISSCVSSVCCKGTVVTILLSLMGFLCKEQSLIVLLVSSLNHFLSYCNLLSKNNNKRRYESSSPSRIKLIQAMLSGHQQQPSDWSTGGGRGSSGACKRSKRSTSSSSATDSSPSDSPTPGCREWRPCSQGDRSSGSRASSCGRGSRKAHLHSCLAFLAAFAGILLLRYLMAGGSLAATFNRFDNPASTEQTGTQLLTYAYVSAFNFGLLLLPIKLACDWTHASLPVIESLLRSENCVTFLFYAAFLAFLLSICRHLRHKQRQSADYARQVSVFVYLLLMRCCPPPLLLVLIHSLRLSGCQ